MKQALAALAASMALHTVAFAALTRGAGGAAQPERRATSATVDLEILGAGTPIARSPRARGESVATPAHPPSVLGRVRPSLRARAVSTPLIPELKVQAVEASGAVPPVSPHEEESPGAPAVAGGTPAGEPGAVDLSAFFERLQHAAQRCSGPRPGEGKVRFCVGADGAATDVSLVQSTGNFALDEAALNCVIPGAAPFPRSDRCLVVPLVFR